MIVLSVSTSLSDLIPEKERIDGRGPPTVRLEATSWPLVVDEVGRRLPRLAERVLTDSGGVASGFLVAVNDDLVSPGQFPGTLSPDDRLFVIPQIAGG